MSINPMILEFTKTGSTGEEIIKSSFKKFTTELDLREDSEQEAEVQKIQREDLLEKYHLLLKEKRQEPIN